jgi:hypothetical protein
MIAILTAVFDHPPPWLAGLNGFPQVSKSSGGHIGVSDNIMVLPEQLLFGESTDGQKCIIYIFNFAIQIGHRDQIFRAKETLFLLCDWLIIFHYVLTSSPGRANNIQPSQWNQYHIFLKT